MTIVEVLEEMLTLLSGPERWCRNAAARNQWGDDVDYSSNEAVAWCLAGAIAKVTRRKTGAIVRTPEEEAASSFLAQRALVEFQASCIPDINDDRLKDYEDMRMFLKRALLEAEELSA